MLTKSSLLAVSLNVLRYLSFATIFSTGTTTWTAVGASSNMTGVTFIATGAGSGTGTAVLSNVNYDVIGTFNTANAANANTTSGQTIPIVVIANT